MNAVGDRADRHLGLIERRPQAVEHAATDLAVEQRHAVSPLGQPEAHHGHVEDPRVTALVVLGAKSQDPLRGHARDRAGPREVLLHQLSGEPVDARRHRGVGREDRARARDLQRGVEVQERTGLVDCEFADPFETQEARVALVGVKDLGDRCAGQAREHPQRAYAADAQEQLLAQAVLAGAAVEPIGDVAILTGVLLDVGVQQEQRHAANVRDPDPRDQVWSAWQRDGDLRPSAIGLAQDGQGKFVGIEDRIGLLLPGFRR